MVSTNNCTLSFCTLIASSPSVGLLHPHMLKKFPYHWKYNLQEYLLLTSQTLVLNIKSCLANLCTCIYYIWSDTVVSILSEYSACHSEFKFREDRHRPIVNSLVQLI